jgi:hypothetical protein
MPWDVLVIVIAGVAFSIAVTVALELRDSRAMRQINAKQQEERDEHRFRSLRAARKAHTIEEALKLRHKPDLRPKPMPPQAVYLRGWL